MPLFRNVNPGDENLHADDYNGAMEICRAIAAGKLKPSPPATTIGALDGTFKIRNDSGSDCPRFGVLGLVSPLIPRANNATAFLNRIALSATTPAAEHAGRFAVCAEPIPDGSIGRAWIDGVCLVKVTIASETDTMADVGTDTATLLSAESGAALILWKEPVEERDDPGIAWCIVRIGGGGGGGDGGIDALLTAWRRYDADDATNPLYGFDWVEAEPGCDGVPVAVLGGRDSGSKGGTVFNIAHSVSQGTVSHDYEPSPGDGESIVLTGDPGDPTDLELGYTHHPMYDGTTYIAVGTTPLGTEFGEFSEASNPQTLSALPTDGSTFYVVISEGITGGGYTEEVYECSITSVPDTWAPAIARDSINRAAAHALRGPAGGGAEAADFDTPATPMDPVFVRLRPITLGCEPPVVRYSFDWPAVELYGVTVDDSDPDVGSDYTDERYYVRRARVGNAAAGDSATAAVSFAGLTGDDAALFTVTNPAESLTHTHGIPVGTPVVFVAVRGGENPHRPRYIMQAGGAGGTTGYTGNFQVVTSVTYNVETCETTGTLKWLEYENGLLIAVHDTDPGA